MVDATTNNTMFTPLFRHHAEVWSRFKAYHDHSFVATRRIGEDQILIGDEVRYELAAMQSQIGWVFEASLNSLGVGSLEDAPWALLREDQWSGFLTVRDLL